MKGRAATARNTMAITSYGQAAAFITKILTDNNQFGAINGAPHKAFWNELSYLEFTTGNVPGVMNNGDPIRILIPGNSANSNLINALRGTGIFDPNVGSEDRMPANGPPYFTDAQIKELADWIDANCPE
jgi:hypothetical protein